MPLTGSCSPFDAFHERFAGLPASARWAIFHAAWERSAARTMGWEPYARAGGPSLAEAHDLSDEALLAQTNMGRARLRRVRAWLAAHPLVAEPSLPRWVTEE